MLKKTRCSVLKRNERRTPVSKAASRSDASARDQIVTVKDWNSCRSASSSPVHPEEKISSLPILCEGWDRKTKRTRSSGPASRASNNGDNQNLPSKSGAGSKLTSHARSSRADGSLDDPIQSPSTRIKIKSCRTPRTGSPFVRPDCVRTSNDASDDLEQHVNAANNMPVEILGQSCRSSSAHAKATVVGQRFHKDLCTRSNEVPLPVLEPSQAQNQSSGLATSGSPARDFSSGISKCLTYGAADNTVQKCEVTLEKVSGLVPLSRDKETRFLENHTEEVQGCCDVPQEHTEKVGCIVLPTERGKKFASIDGVEKQGRIATELCMRRDGIVDGAGRENMPKTTSLKKTTPAFKKKRSKSGLSSFGKRSEQRALSRVGRKLQSQDPAEIDDDHQEKLAAAASACKASYRACSSRLWKKVEPIFGPPSTEDRSFLKQQLSIGQKLQDSLSQIATSSSLGVVMHEESDLGEKLRSLDEVAPRTGAGDGSVQVSSLHERVLSALIEEDECGGNYNAVEGISVSIQCPSDDSHCDSCNCADVETRDRDRMDSEAESRFDVQMQKRSCGDKSSCNKSISSNTTRNSSMSDSLYSSGRCQGDDGFSHSDEFVSEVCQNDQSELLLASVNACGPSISNSQYQLMCIDERLVLELQSIGLLLDSLPDLTEEEEAIDHDIMENLEGLSHRVAKKKMNLSEIAKSIQDGRERDKQDIEQVAMDKLVEMAYRGRMVCRADQDSKRVIRRVSKQFALGFMKRTIARCQTFEFTGQSCFREPSLQRAICSALEGEQTDPLCLGVEDSRLKAAKHETSFRGSGSNSAITVLDPSTRSLGSVGGGGNFPGYGSGERNIAQEHGRKVDPLLSHVACESQEAVSCVRALVQAKGKRSARDAILNKTTMRGNTFFEKNQPSSGTFGSGQKAKEKSKMKTKLTSSLVNRLASKSAHAVSCIQPCPSFQSKDVGGKKGGRTGVELTFPEVVIQNSLEEATQPDSVEIDPIEELGVSNDLSSWFDDDMLQDYDSIGLEIPMDDISDLDMVF